MSDEHAEPARELVRPREAAKYAWPVRTEQHAQPEAVDTHAQSGAGQPRPAEHCEHELRERQSLGVRLDRLA
eukprot:5615952-Lingulodinium_polyedra.AAC.1